MRLRRLQRSDEEGQWYDDAYAYQEHETGNIVFRYNLTWEALGSRFNSKIKQTGTLLEEIEQIVEPGDGLRWLPIEEIAAEEADDFLAVLNKTCGIPVTGFVGPRSEEWLKARNERVTLGQKMYLADVKDHFHGWLSRSIHWMAVSHALFWQKKKIETPSIWELAPNYNQVWSGWSVFYGCLNLTLHLPEELMRNVPADLNWTTMQVFGKNTHWWNWDQQGLADFFGEIEHELRLALPGSRQENSMRFCSLSAHPFSQMLHICEEIAGTKQWVCDHCLEYYGLTMGTDSGHPRWRLDEKLRLQQRVRLKVLERDGFTCQKCRRSGIPYQHDVTFSVVPIPGKPGRQRDISKFQTICSVCLSKQERPSHL